MRPFQKLLTTIIGCLAPLAAQDYRDLHASIAEFKALPEEAVKKNALLSTGANAITASKGGVSSILNGLGLAKPAPAGETPVIRLSKEQQAVLDREAAKQAKAKGLKPSAGGPAAEVQPVKRAALPLRSAAKSVASPAAIDPFAPAPEARPVAPAQAVAVAAAPAAPPKPESRRISEDSAKKIAEGMDREQLLSSLGPPKSQSAIMGLEDGTRETFSYELESGRMLFVKVLGGKVSSISR